MQARSPEQVLRLRAHEVSRSPRRALYYDAAHVHRGSRLGGLAHDHRGGRRDLVCKRDLSDPQRTPEEIWRADEIHEARQAGGTDRDADDAIAPRSPETVVHHHRQINAEFRVEPLL